MPVISADECRFIKLRHFLETAGQRVLTYTLQCGTAGKAPTDSLVKYLDNLPQTSTAKYLVISKKEKQKSFNKTDTTQINSDPSCTKLDITLLHKAIKLACENVAHPHEEVNGVNKWNSASPVPGCELEHFTTKIKDTRNSLMHDFKRLDDAAFRNEMTTLRNLFDSCLSATKNRYKRQDSEYQNEKQAMETTFIEINNEVLGEEEMLQRTASYMLPDFKKEIDKELTTKLKSTKFLDPLQFLSGLPAQRVEVKDLFCDIMLAEEKWTTLWGDDKRIPYLEVLRLCEDTVVSPPGQPRPQVLLVEGEAGVGKTTMAKFLLDQWLTLEDDRSVQGMDRYELLLWLTCRDQSGPTFPEFMRTLLPESYLRYGNLFVPLLKLCRILMIFEGVDECNTVSRHLVADILKETAATTSSIICTSRPHSVKDMKTEARRLNFNVSHVKLLGITDTQRTQLVVNHYSCLCSAANTPADTDALRLAVEGIVGRELFRLPLNLSFLATLFFFQPHKVSSAASQAMLYEEVHTWCIQKLQDRLGAHGHAGHARVLRENALGRALHVLYEVSLKGLLQDRLYLSREDLKDVQAACSGAEGVNPEEFLSALCCLRREERLGAVKETYQAPHKGLQDYMSAKHLAGQIHQGREGEIARTLRRYTAGEDPPLAKLRDALGLMLGLMTLQRDTGVAAVKEAVDLLRKSGVTKATQWLPLLTDAAAPDAVVQHVAGILVKDELISVTNDTEHVAGVLLQHLPQRKVQVRLFRELDDVKNLARILASHTLILLLLDHHWMHPDQHSSSATLLRGLPRSALELFRGNIEAEDLQLLPESLEQLELVLSDSQHANSLLPALAAALQAFPRKFPRLQYICLHIPVAAVTSGAVMRLPSRPGLYLGLYLSGVTSELSDTAGDIAAVMCPPEGFWSLSFAKPTLDFKGWEALFRQLQHAGVKVRDTGGYGGVRVPQNTISGDEAKQLTTFTITALGLCKVYRVDDSDWK